MVSSCVGHGLILISKLDFIKLIQAEFKDLGKSEKLDPEQPVSVPSIVTRIQEISDKLR